MRKIYSLDQEFGLIKFEKAVSIVEESIKEEKKKKKKNLIKALSIIVSFAALFSISIVTKNFLLLITSLSSFSGVMVVNQIMNIKNEEKTIKNKNVNLDDNYKKNDFFSDKYKEATKNMQNVPYKESLNDLKYEEALKKQKREKMILEGKNVDIEEAIEACTEESNTFTFAYNLPKVIISDDEWNLFLENLYEYFKDNNTDNFLEVIVQIFRLTCAKAIFYNYNEITIYNLIDDLEYLEGINYSMLEIKKIQKIILEDLKNHNIEKNSSKCEIINFDEYKKKMLKK